MKTSGILLNLNFLGETAFLEGIFCLEYPNIHVSQTTDFHFANYRFSFRKLQISISQTTDFHFANYRFPFRKLQISISQTTDSRFANYRFLFRKLQISISQTTDFHFANYRFPFRFVPFRFVSFCFVPFCFANYSKPDITAYALTITSARLKETFQYFQTPSLQSQQLHDFG